MYGVQSTQVLRNNARDLVVGNNLVEGLDQPLDARGDQFTQLLFHSLPAKLGIYDVWKPRGPAFTLSFFPNICNPTIKMNAKAHMAA
jgi:hypothetical protein